MDTKMGGGGYSAPVINLLIKFKHFLTESFKPYVLVTGMGSCTVFMTLDF